MKNTYAASLAQYSKVFVAYTFNKAHYPPNLKSGTPFENWYITLSQLSYKDSIYLAISASLNLII